MKLLFIFLIVFISGSLVAQLQHKDQWEREKRKLLNEKLNNMKDQKIHDSTGRIESMPVLKLKRKGKFLENNGKGSDLYAMEPDNMPCIVPDSNYIPTMPGAFINRKNKKLFRNP